MIRKSDFFKKYRIKKNDFDQCGIRWQELIEIYKEYSENSNKFQPVAEYFVSNLLKINNVHSVRYRIKDPEHLIAKIIRKRIDDPNREINKSNYLNEITDIIGLRILHLFKNDWINIHTSIVETWSLKEKPTANVREGDSTDLFDQADCTIKKHIQGYRSVHYLLITRPSNHEFVAEIQVRTIFEEAWSEIDHTVRYPYELDNPILNQFLTIFNRLAGSADEMGSFIKFLQHELNQRDEIFKIERLRLNEKIKKFEEHIRSLEISQEQKDKLIKDLKSTLNSQKLSSEYTGNGIFEIATGSKVTVDWLNNKTINIGNISDSDTIHSWQSLTNENLYPRIIIGNKKDEDQNQ